MQRLRRFTRGWTTAMLAGGLFFMPVGRSIDPNPEHVIVQAFLLFVFGALCGLVVLGGIRLFRTSGFGLVVAGILSGYLPALVIAPAKTPQEDFAGVWLLSMILGLLVGLLEWARVRREEREAPLN